MQYILQGLSVPYIKWCSRQC